MGLTHSWMTCCMLTIAFREKRGETMSLRFLAPSYSQRVIVDSWMAKLLYKYGSLVHRLRWLWISLYAFGFEKCN